MEITASSFKLRANAPEGQKAISYQKKKEADARALAEERMLKLIGGKELDTFLNAILNKPQ